MSLTAGIRVQVAGAVAGWWHEHPIGAKGHVAAVGVTFGGHSMIPPPPSKSHAVGLAVDGEPPEDRVLCTP
jgi:hypothetical protein